MMGLGAVPDSHPLNLGMSGMHGRYASTVAQSKADLIVAAGVRFSDRATGSVAKYTRNCSVIHIDIDHAELGKNVRPDLSLRGDVKAILAALAAKLEPQPRPEWLAEVDALKSEVPPEPADVFSPRNIIRAVHANVPRDAVIATDVGQHQMWVAQHYPFELPRTLLTSGGLGAMGFGLGAAIGGCLASGRKRTVHFTSDGSFGMNLNELATAVSQNLPIVTVILNNSVLGMVRQWQSIFYEQRYSQTTLNRKTDFAKLAEAFGATGARVRTLAELESALRALPYSPMVLDCEIDPDTKVLPMIPPGGGVEDIRLN
jgi:acetolactate synthase-1/2/3 large subunit